MQLETAVAKRYARALFRVLGARGETEACDRAAELLQALAAAVREHGTLRQVLANPAIDAQRKAAVLAEIVERMGGDAVLQRFARVVAEHERADRLPEIARAFRARVDAARGVLDAEVVTPRPLGAGEIERLAKQLAARTGRQVRLRTNTDPTLLGGLVTRIGDVIYDGSLRHQLARLRERMAGS